jgi:hypothetical protein
MARKIGALVVAEGIESEEEALSALELGADILQGYYFSRKLARHYMDLSHCQDPINRTASRFRDYMVERTRRLKSLHARYESLARTLVQQLSAIEQDDYDRQLAASIQRFPQVEYMYVLDSSGIQTTETVGSFQPPTNVNPLYGPAKKGTDHSLKDYYYLPAHTDIRKFTTEPYISLASGNISITISRIFRSISGERMILCIDIKPS